MLRVFLLVFICLYALPVSAQGLYTNGTDAAINNTSLCTTPILRDIQVLDNFTIGEVELDFLASHAWRGDIQLQLASPAGTVVTLIELDTTFAGNIDNYNIRLDDDSGTLVNTAPHDTADNVAAAAPQNIVRPDNLFSAFDGEGADGTWQLRMCDGFPAADNETFLEATLRLTPVAPPPAPSLVCSVGTPLQLAWTAPGGTFGWPAGSIATQSYTVSGYDLSIALSGDVNRFAPRNGTDTPVTSTDVGGTGQFALLSNANFEATSEAITYTLSLGNPGIGFGGVQFDMFDVDAQEGAWQDRFEVSASLDGASVPVTLTPTLAANYVDGNAFVGLAPIPSAGGGGEGRITVSQPLDELTVIYRTGVRSPANPAAQVSAFSLIDFCPPEAAQLSASKTVAVVGGGFAIPGSDIAYTLSVTNLGTSTVAAEAINVADTLPEDLVFVSAVPSGFTGGAFAPALPATNTDCAGSACVVSFAGASLDVGETGEILITARLK